MQNNHLSGEQLFQSYFSLNNVFNSLMTEAPIILQSKSMYLMIGTFLYDRNLRYVKDINKTTAKQNKFTWKFENLSHK